LTIVPEAMTIIGYRSCPAPRV